jgi:hypothetical protein
MSTADELGGSLLEVDSGLGLGVALPASLVVHPATTPSASRATAGRAAADLITLVS